MTIDASVDREYTNLLFSYYEKAQLSGVPFAFFILYLFYGKISTPILVTFLILKLTTHAVMFWLAKCYNRAPKIGAEGSRRWRRFALIAAFTQGLVWSIIITFIDTDMAIEFGILSLFLSAGILVYCATGFSLFVLAYSVPIFGSVAITNFVQFVDYQYLSWVSIIGIFIVYSVVQIFEKTLLQTIEVRFENQELLSALELKKEEAEQANSAKSVFLASASHDLRQPLHAIGLYLDTLRSEASTDAQKNIAGKISNSVDVLNRLFESLLDVTQLDSGVISPNYKNFDVKNVIDQSSQRYYDEAKFKGLEIVNKVESAVVHSDPILLDRIVSNLVSNAIQYTDNGTISILGFREGDLYTINILDTGAGIPTSEQEKIFSEFYQLPTKHIKKKTGLGLGLSIVNKICRLLEYPITLKSEEGVGSSFAISLPLPEHAEVDSSVINDHFALTLNGRCILFLDDDLSIRDSLSSVMRRWGCKVVVCDSTESALGELSKGLVPDLMIADYRLGNNDNGLTAITKVRESLQNEIPAIIVTGDTSPELMPMLSSHSQKVLYKPLNPGLLRKSLTLLLHHENTHS